MTVRDIPEVIEIERLSFSMTWPANAYKRELEQNRMARYVVARYQPGPGEPPPPPRPKATRRPFPLSLLPVGERSDGGEPSSIVGYAGLWLMVDEAHVTSVSVHPDFRGRGLGKLLMLTLMELAMRLEARWVTLEVRVSNSVARALYEGLGFRQVGIRPRYYTDNDEDAVVMWSEDLRSPSFRERLRAMRQALSARLSWSSGL
jgi:ribosomal-protein-alanine N-acetyltransferase